jgi:hypothetical protein
MITTLLGGVYATTVLGCTYNMAKIRLNDDYVEEFKQLREYDFTYEKIDSDSLPKKALVHINLDDNEHNRQYSTDPKMGVKDALKDGETLVYSKVISFSNLLDPTMYYRQKFDKNGPKFEVKNPNHDQELTIDFTRSKCTMFDINTMALLMKYNNGSTLDS